METWLALKQHKRVLNHMGSYMVFVFYWKSYFVAARSDFIDAFVDRWATLAGVGLITDIDVWKNRCGANKQQHHKCSCNFIFYICCLNFCCRTPPYFSYWMYYNLSNLWSRIREAQSVLWARICWWPKNPNLLRRAKSEGSVCATRYIGGQCLGHRPIPCFVNAQWLVPTFKSVIASYNHGPDSLRIAAQIGFRKIFCFRDCSPDWVPDTTYWAVKMAVAVIEWLETHEWLPMICSDVLECPRIAPSEWSLIRAYIRNQKYSNILWWIKNGSPAE